MTKIIVENKASKSLKISKSRLPNHSYYTECIFNFKLRQLLLFLEENFVVFNKYSWWFSKLGSGPLFKSRPLLAPVVWRFSCVGRRDRNCYALPAVRHHTGLVTHFFFVRNIIGYFKRGLTVGQTS